MRPTAGVLTAISAPEGSEVPVGALLGCSMARVPRGAAAAEAGSSAEARRASTCAAPGGHAAARRESRRRASRGPVARPATPPADVAAHAPLPAAARSSRNSICSPSRSAAEPARTAASPRATCWNS